MRRRNGKLGGRGGGILKRDQESGPDLLRGTDRTYSSQKNVHAVDSLCKALAIVEFPL